MAQCCILHVDKRRKYWITPEAAKGAEFSHSLAITGMFIPVWRMDVIHKEIVICDINIPQIPLIFASLTARYTLT